MFLIIFLVFCLVSFAILPKEQREIIMKERLKAAFDRQSTNNENRFFRQYRDNEDYTCTLHYRFNLGTDSNIDQAICMNAFRNIFGIFRRPWETLKQNIRNSRYVTGPISHGNCQKHSQHMGSNAKKTEGSMIAFLKDLADNYSEPYATRFIQSYTSVGLQNDEEGLAELPSNFTKQKLYIEWCLVSGILLALMQKDLLDLFLHISYTFLMIYCGLLDQSHYLSVHGTVSLMFGKSPFPSSRLEISVRMYVVSVSN
jgi:hypothetical protein